MSNRIKLERINKAVAWLITDTIRYIGESNARLDALEVKYGIKTESDDYEPWNGTDDGDFDEDDIGSGNSVVITPYSNDTGNSSTSIITTSGILAGYPDGSPIIDLNTNTPYPSPSGMNIGANISAAEQFSTPYIENSIRDSYMISQFYTGGPQDYQRPNGLIAAVQGDVNISYRSITNYNYGAVSAAAGYSLEDALNAAGTYNQLFGMANQPDMASYGIQQESVNNITHGYNDYLNGKW